MTVEQCGFCKGTGIEPGFTECVWCASSGKAGGISAPSQIGRACAELKAQTAVEVTRYNTVQLRFATGELAKAAFVDAADYDAALAREAALREELAPLYLIKDSFYECRNQRDKAWDNLKAAQEKLTAAEQRNSACNAEIVAMVESALRRSFSLGQVYWQQADSDSTCQQNKSDQTMEVQAQHILNVVKSINALTNPTESGASE
jgi:hypothetical protein